MAILSKLKERVFHRGLKNSNDSRLNIIHESTTFAVRESYKTARTNLMFTMAGEEGCKKIIVTSPVAREGKSTTSLNLAITFAQTGARVLVIDADLRCPKLHSYLSLKNDVGMAQYLGGFKSNYRDIIRKISKYNLDCITGGPIPPNPSELLISSSMEKLLNELSAEYDYIIVDSPPVNLVADSISIAKYMTGALLVVRQNYTTSESLRQAISALEFGQIKILGCVLNAVTDTHKRSYKSNYYKSGYYYR